MSHKRILITGVSRGLGRALTDKFIQLGHTVIGCARDKTAIARLKKQYGLPHRFEAVDVADDAQVERWAKAVLAEAGPPDLLLNNAALMNNPAPLWQVPRAEFDALIDVNIKGVANVIRHFVPAMVAKKHGVICNFSSGWGRSTDAQVAPYCATKWAMEGLSQALAQELPRGMAAIPLSPGIINTEMLQSCFGGDAAAYPTAEQWAEDAAPWLLKLGPKDNGRSLTVGD